MPQNSIVFLPRASARSLRGCWSHRSRSIDGPVAPLLINLGTCGSGSSTRLSPTKATGSVPQHPLAVAPRHHLGTKQHGAALLGLLHASRPSQPGSRSPHGLDLLSVTPWGHPAPNSVSPHGDTQLPGRAAGSPPCAPADTRKPGLLCPPRVLIFSFSRPACPRQEASLLSLLGLSSRWGCNLTQTVLLAWGLQSISLSLAPASPHLTSASPNPLAPQHISAAPGINPQRGVSSAPGAGRRWPGAHSDTWPRVVPAPFHVVTDKGE